MRTTTTPPWPPYTTSAQVGILSSPPDIHYILLLAYTAVLSVLIHVLTAAHDLLQALDKRRWVAAYCPAPRFDRTTSAASESLNKLQAGLRIRPLVAYLEGYVLNCNHRALKYGDAARKRAASVGAADVLTKVGQDCLDLHIEVRRSGAPQIACVCVDVAAYCCAHAC